MLASTSCDELAQDAACSDICEKLRDCNGLNFSLSKCTDECVETTFETHRLRDMSEDCADCLEDYSCRYVASRCGVCNDILDVFTHYRFKEPN